MEQTQNSLAIIDMVEIQQVQATMNKISQFQQVIQKTLHQGHDFGVIPGTDKPTLLKPGAEKILMMMGLRSEFEIADSTRNFEKGFFQYQVRCKLLKGDVLITEGLGSCNTRERKYLKMDPYTMDNTVLKMAKKRAMVDAALLVASLSDVFTQDLEDIDLIGQQTGGRRYYTDQDGTISRAQAKRMFAIAKGNADLVKAIIREYKYEKSEQVKKTEYEEVCARIESETKALNEARDGLFTKVKELGVDSEQVKDYMAILFKVDNSKKLNKEQIAELIKHIERQEEFSEEDVHFVEAGQEAGQ